MALSKREKLVMAAVYATCEGRDSCLVSPEELLGKLPQNAKFNMNELNKLLKLLELDDYFDIIYSEKKGAEILCINLHTKGQAFKRDKQQTKRYLLFKLWVTVGFAVLSFIIGIVLKKIFS